MGTSQYRHLFFPLSRLGAGLFRQWHQLINDCSHRGGITGFHTAGVIRCCNRDYRDVIVFRIFFAEGIDSPLHVTALGFRQASGRYAHQCR